MGTERELKYDLEADRDVDLRGVPGTAGPEHRVTLVADYWDTPSGRLRAWGVTVRHRRASDDSELGWTVKIPVPAEVGERGGGAARTRREVDVEGHPSAPPARVLAVVSGLLGGEPLVHVARLTTVRTSTHRSTGERPGVDPGVRLDCDRVAVEVGDDVHRFLQLEVESTGDDALLDRVERWASEVGLTPSAAANKLEQALGPGRAAAPETPVLDRRSHTRAVVRAAIAGPVRAMVALDPLLRDELAQLPTIGSTQPDGGGATWDPDVGVVHAAAAATRRLSDDLAAFEELLEPVAVDRIADELDTWVELVGALDDALALQSRLRPFGRNDTFVSLVEDSAEAAARRVSAEVHQPGFHALLSDLLALAADPPLADGVDGGHRATDMLIGANRRAWKELAATVHRAEDAVPGSPAAEARTFEISAAAGRSATLAALSAPVVGDAASDAAERLGALHDLLAAHHDAVLLQQWIERLVVAEGRDLDAATAFRAGELHMAARLDPARTTDWHPLWERARKRRPSHW